LLLLMKTINIKLSAFIVTVNKIIRSMTWFLVILIIGCYSFAGVMMMAITATKPEYCHGVDITDESIQADYCSLNPNRGAMRAFAMMAGDVSLDDYSINSYTTYIWIFYSLYGVIVLLNVLIAVVNDAYQQSYAKRLALANRERLPYLTKHLRLRAVARKWFDNESKCRYFWRVLCFCLIIIYILVWHFVVFATWTFFSQHRKFDITLIELFWEGQMRVIILMLLLLICTFVADVALIYIGLKLFGLQVCSENKQNRFKVMLRKFVKSMVCVFLGEYDQSELNESESYLVTMREVVEGSECRINSKLDELQEQMSILSLNK